MLDPRTVMLAMPCYDGKVMAEFLGQVIGVAGKYFGAVSLPTECSHVSLARNLIAGTFLASHCEWLVCIDSDIVPHSGVDFDYLMEPCNATEVYCDADEARPDYAHALPRPTRIQCRQRELDYDAQEVIEQVAEADVLVCAEYAYKQDEHQAVHFGMGFTRIHRSVFKTLEALKHDGGPTVEVRRDLFEQLKAWRADGWGKDCQLIIEQLLDTTEDKAGTPRLWQVSHKGRLYTDFFPSGPILSQFVPTAEWKGEDHGFFTLCQLAGIVPRIETRTRLLHVGRKAYPYLGPEEVEGQ